MSLKLNHKLISLVHDFLLVTANTSNINQDLTLKITVWILVNFLVLSGSAQQQELSKYVVYVL